MAWQISYRRRPPNATSVPKTILYDTADAITEEGGQL